MDIKNIKKGEKLYLPVTVEEVLGDLVKTVPVGTNGNWCYVNPEYLVEQTTVPSEKDTSKKKTNSVPKNIKTAVIEALSKVQIGITHFRNEGCCDLRDVYNMVSCLEDVYCGKMKQSEWDDIFDNEEY